MDTQLMATPITAGIDNQSSFLEGLLSCVSTGDTQALSDLYTHTSTSVYGLLLSLLRHPQDAEDILQDTYVRIYHSASSYKPQGKPLAWIFTIARNLAMSRLRTRKRTVNLTIEEWDSYFSLQPDVSSEDKAVLSAAMSTLKPKEAEIVMLHVVAGLKHREIADYLGSPLSTVLSRYNRSIKKLQATLTEGNGYE